jgi:hypothetical protein
MGLFRQPSKLFARKNMKKAVALLFVLTILVPVSVWANGEGLKEKFNISNVEHSAFIADGSTWSTIAHVTTIDGKEFIIPVSFNKKSLSATFCFASGKTAILSSSGVDIVQGEGYQEFDDVDNSTDIFETYVSDTCILNIIAWIIFPGTIGLIFLIFAVLTCL